MLDTPGPGGFTYRQLGVSSEALRAQFAHRAAQQEAPADSVSVQPQVKRQILRRRLDSRSKSVHQRILTDVGIPRAGYDISRSIKDVRGNNIEALYVVLNREINSFVGKPDDSRNNWAIGQLQAGVPQDEWTSEIAGRWSLKGCPGVTTEAIVYLRVQG